MLKPVPDTIAFFEGYTVTFTGDMVEVECHTTGTLAYSGSVPHGFTREEFLELFEEEE